MRISEVKREKISEQILAVLYSSFPKMLFTAQIAREIARDEEFIKAMLQDLKIKNLVSEINKNPSGIEYTRRQRWLLSPQAFDAYKKQQSQSQQAI